MHFSRCLLIMCVAVLAAVLALVVAATTFDNDAPPRLMSLHSHRNNNNNQINIRSQPPSAWRGRRIYQILTDRFAVNPGSQPSSCNNVNVYCGGTFAGAQSKLDYIAGMGFNAIWISPVVQNIDSDGAYHGYWMSNTTAINQHFGTAAQLESFVKACHARDIWVMVDVVINHVGPVGTDYSQIYPFNSSQYYHSDCAVTQYVCETHEVQFCRLANLPDLKQEDPFVTEQLKKYVQFLMGFGFDGIRLDTVMYVPNNFVNEIVTQNSGTYVVGEVYSNWACNTNYIDAGDISASLNYDLFHDLRSVFVQRQSMRALGKQWRRVMKLPYPYLEGNFVDNQDNSRFLTASGATVPLYKSALSHLTFQIGVPIVYYGTEQLFSGGSAGCTNNECRKALWPSNYNTNADMYKFIANMNQAYEKFNLGSLETEERWMDDSMYCFIRGKQQLSSSVLHCTANTLGTEQTRTIPNLPFRNGQTVCDWFHPDNNCQQGASTMTITVGSDGLPILLYAKH